MRTKLMLFPFVLLSALVTAKESGIFPTLATNAALGKQKQGFYLLPTNQLLRPWGEQALIKGRPVDLAFDSRKHLLAVLNWRGIDILDAASGAQIADLRARATSYGGIAFRPGDREIWAGETSGNGPDAILVQPISETGQPGEGQRIALTGHPVPCGIAFSPDGKTAYVALSRNNSVAVIDAEAHKLLREIPVGVAPHGVVFAKSAGKIYVTNRGGRRPAAEDTVAPTSGAMAVTNPVTGSTATGTVSVIDTRNDAVSEIVVGLAPSSLALSPDEALLAVANSHEDSVSVIETKNQKRKDVRIPAYPQGTLGSQPVALAFSPDARRLYVACGGNNAIAILSHESSDWKVAGAIPTGWFPSGVAIDNAGDLRVLNIKGVGNTDNGKGSFNSRAYEGSLLKIPAPVAPQIAAGTREVIAANSPHFESAGGIANLSSLGIEHVFFIIKENRTYDQVFGDMKQGNGDATLVMYGRDVTPNHHALAEKYVLLDNFYASGAISFDGHQWLMQAFVSDYVERAFGASPRGYAWNMADALTVSPEGMFWQSATKPLSVRIYGEFCLPAKWDAAKQSVVDIDRNEGLGWTQYWSLYKEAKWQGAVGSKSGVPALERYIDARYPGNGTGLPDEIRSEELLRELHDFEKSGKLPNLLVVTLANDHTNGTRPGSPTPRAMVANNDIALGRIVEAISKSRFWATSLILVVEDDAQDGLDHVDGHRTVAIAIGPHVRRGAVDSNNYNHTSMVRTIQEIFEIPAKTRALASARAMRSVFTAEADLSPYEPIAPKQSLEEMNRQLSQLKGRELWAARESLAMNWSRPDDINVDVLNRILWWDSKGYDKPYPEKRK